LQLCLKLLHADSGESRLFGLDPEDLYARRRIGYAPDAPLFPKAMTGAQILELHCDLLRIPRAAALALSLELGFAEVARRPTATYSRGQAQRLGLVQALLGDPELLLLDEPTAGLDPAGVALVRERLVSSRRRGAAVLLNSHLLSEVERVCDRVLFMKAGRLLHVHDARSGRRYAQIRVGDAAVVARRHPEATVDGDRLRFEVRGEEDVPGIVRQLVEGGARLFEVSIQGEELEELYLEVVEGRA
jgi:ABC-2 type transport system ATP-binding protein